MYCAKKRVESGRAVEWLAALFNLKVVMRQECNVSHKLQRLTMHVLSLNLWLAKVLGCIRYIAAHLGELGPFRL